MKTLVILFGLIGCSSNNGHNKEIGEKTQIQEYEVVQKSVIGDDLYVKNENIKYEEQENIILKGIQNKIIDSALEGFAKKDIKKLVELEKRLNESKINNKNLKNYWLAYINYYKTIINYNINKDEKTAKESSKIGIKLLESNSPLNTDDYALLVLLKSLTYPWENSIFLTQEINNIIEKMDRAGKESIRTLYAKASIDFYTPKIYGGGKQVEELLKRVLDNKETKKSDDDEYPSWGKEEAYDMLIRFYIKENNKKEAIKYYERAKEYFPNSKIIRNYKI